MFIIVDQTVVEVILFIVSSILRPISAHIECLFIMFQVMPEILVVKEFRIFQNTQSIIQATPIFMVKHVAIRNLVFHWLSFPKNKEFFKSDSEGEFLITWNVIIPTPGMKSFLIYILCSLTLQCYRTTDQNVISFVCV